MLGIYLTYPSGKESIKSSGKGRRSWEGDEVNCLSITFGGCVRLSDRLSF